MRRRPVVMIRPATLSSRSRRRLGSQVRAGVWDQASSWVQVSKSAASWTSSSQISFLANDCRGRLVSPVSFSARIRSSARARRRWRTSRSASRPPTVLVAKTVIRQPWSSVMRSCAPGWGLSRRAMTRIPDGHPGERHRNPPGHFGDLRSVAGPPVGVHRATPRLLRQRAHASRMGRRIFIPTQNSSPRSRTCHTNALTPGAGIATHLHPRAHRFGQLGKSRVEDRI